VGLIGFMQKRKIYWEILVNYKMKFKFSLILLSLIIVLAINFVAAQGEFCVDFDKPSAPTNLVLSGSVNNVQLTWNASIDIPECSGIAYYTIYRDEAKIGITSFNTLNFIDDNVSYGTYNYRVSAVDKVNHEGAYVEGTITLTAPGGEEGGIAGVSVGVPYEKLIQPLNLGINILQKGVSYTFSFYGEEHKLEITETGDDYVLITIYSEEQKIELKIGEIKEVDLNNDGIPDVSFRLTSLSSSRKAGIEFRTIIKEGAEEIISEEEPLDLNVAQEEKGFFPGITGAVVGALGPAATIGVLIIIIVIVAILIFVVMRKKKNKSYQ